MFALSAVREARIEKLRGLMAQKELDTLILTRLENVRYATDIKPLHGIFFTEMYISVIDSEEKPFLLASEADCSFVKAELPWVAYVPLPSFLPAGTLADLQAHAVERVLSKEAKRVGYDRLLVEQYNSLAVVTDAELIPVDNDILRVRAIKTDGELDIMGRAVQFAEIGMEAVRQKACPGITEAELAAEAIYAVKKAGAEAESHMPALRSGENAAMLQRVESDTRVRPGDPIVADLGARYLGYSAEYCRTIMVGRPSKKLKAMYQVLFDAYYAGIEMIKSGTVVKEIDGAIREVITKAGYPDYPHATGHGIGMANGEYPTINRSSEATLEPNMVVCLEPGIYLPGVGGVKEEDLILVTDEGYCILTQTPYDPLLT